MRKDITIRPERVEEREAILDLVLRSFRDGTDYSDGTGEVALIQEIWRKPYYLPDLAFVAEVDGQMVGHFMLTRFPISRTAQGGHDDDATSPMLLLAPVAVDPALLRQGIGSAMLHLGIEKARQAGYKGIVVEGNPAFYHRVGFRQSTDFGLIPVGDWLTEHPQCQMCLELYPGAMEGISGYVVYDMYENA